jgi:hypothetical protein
VNWWTHLGLAAEVENSVRSVNRAEFVGCLPSLFRAPHEWGSGSCVSRRKEKAHSIRVCAPIILDLRPTLAEHESESMQRTYLVSREREREERRDKANGSWEKHTVH